MKKFDFLLIAFLTLLLSHNSMAKNAAAEIPQVERSGKYYICKSQGTTQMVDSVSKLSNECQKVLIKPKLPTSNPQKTNSGLQIQKAHAKYIEIANATAKLPDFALRNTTRRVRFRDELVPILFQLMKTEPNNPEIYRIFGNVYYTQCDYQLSTENYLKAYQLGLRDVDIFLALSDNLCYIHHQPSKAIEILTEGGRYFPQESIFQSQTELIVSLGCN
jgi:hypothetical protein